MIARAEPTRRARLARLAFLYAALFTWQFGIGTFCGRETGFLIYFVLAGIPVFLAGTPWIWVFMGAEEYFRPQAGALDLTVLDRNTLLYHAIVLASFALNIAVVFKFSGWLDRPEARSGRK